MTRIKDMGIGAVLLLASTSALAHSGHEAIGDVLHFEYLLMVGAAVAVAVYAVVRDGRGGRD